MIRSVCVGAALCLPNIAFADLKAQNMRYSCERSVEVPVVYVTSGDASVAVLMVEGRQILLYSEPAASGARYGWPSDGSNYVWATQDNTASLFWKDETGAETPILAACKLQ